MDVTRKDATITNLDDAFPGSFEVILSAPTKDRDGDTLLPDEWKTPLPEHITFDQDHGMSVASTVGSGVPRIDEKTGNLIVSGTYSSLPRAQEVRTLVNEGHIKTTSVAFMSEKTQKDGVTAITRELLNGAFVAIPSNREALVLSAKSLKAKTTKAEHIQAIHDHAIALGAAPAATDGKSFTVKDAADDPAGQIAAIDAALDQASILFRSVDTTLLPAEVQQAIALVTAAETTVDELMDVLGIPDPDDEPEPGAASVLALDAAKAVSTATTHAAPVEDESDEIQARAAHLRLLSLISGRQ